MHAEDHVAVPILRTEAPPTHRDTLSTYEMQAQLFNGNMYMLSRGNDAMFR